MEKIKERITKDLKNPKLYICLFITMIFFGIFIKMDFTTDTYSVIESPGRQMFNHFLSSGRFITAFAYAVTHILHFKIEMTYLLSFLLAVVSITFSIYRLYQLLNKDIKKDLISMVIATLIIINPFSIELFMYIEKGIMTFSILMSILALEKLVQFFEGNKKAFKYVVIFMLIADFCYQGTVAIFIALASVYVIKYSKNIKEFIKNNVFIVLGYGVPAIINLFVVRLFFANSRVSGNIDIIESIHKVIQGIKNMFTTYSIMPKYIFIICLAIITLLVIYEIISKKCIKNSQTAKGKLGNSVLVVLELGYICIATIGTTIFPQLLQDTASIWFVARSTYAFASLIGITCMFAYILHEEYFTKIVNCFMIAIAIIFMMIQYGQFVKIEIDHYTVNYMDQTISMQIADKIYAYEQETGISVTKISFYKDKMPSYTYPGIFATGDMNLSALTIDWSINHAIQYYTNREFEVVENDEKIKEQFESKNWTYFEEEEIIIIGDTVHLCIF